MAPFWKGLEDYESSWTDAQLVAAAKGLPIPEPEPEPEPGATDGTATTKTTASPEDINKLTLPIAPRSRAQSYTSDASPSSSTGNFSNLSLPLSSAFPNLTRPRAKTFGIGRANSSNTGPVETTMGNAPVNGRPLEAVLYDGASECPICFLYYPPYLNRTRCCDNPICSECFVQIKRTDPHIPEQHTPPTSPEPRPADTTDGAAQDPDQLVSEAASCPYCQESDFGIIYHPPPYRRGLIYVNQQHPYAAQHHSPLSYTSVTSSNSSLPPSSPTSPTSATRRKISYASTAPEVITTDRIRPDWSTKLAHARNQAARRAAAATALHTAAYLMGGLNGSSSNAASTFVSSRRLLRRAGHSNGASGSGSDVSTNGTRARAGSESTAYSSEGVGHPAGTRVEGNGLMSTRRGRMIDLEEMMLMEAIRLSLAEEEDRKKREEKEAKKNNKKKEKEDKKTGRFLGGSGSSPSLSGRHPEPSRSVSQPIVSSNPSLMPQALPKPETASSPIQIPKSSSSSSVSSVLEPGSSSNSPRMSSNNIIHSDDEEEGVSNEPMFNFRSLAQTLMEDGTRENNSDDGKGKEVAQHFEHSPAMIPDVEEGTMEDSVMTIKGKEPAKCISDVSETSMSLDKGKNVAV